MTSPTVLVSKATSVPMRLPVAGVTVRLSAVTLMAYASMAALTVAVVAVRLKADPAKSVMPAFTLIVVAVRLRLCAAPVPEASMAALTVIVLTAAMLTSLVTSDATIAGASMVQSTAPPAAASKVGSSPSFAPPAAIRSRFAGSRRSVPVAPTGALVSTEPLNARAPLPDTSTSPPSPPARPPCALTSPKNAVLPSDQITAWPPSPLANASARIRLSALTYVTSDRRSSPEPW